MIFESFLILLPMIVVVLGGYLVAMIFDISEDTLIRVVTDFFMPMLVFYSLYTSGIDFLETLKLAGYKVRDMRVFDMSPHTPHIETVLLLEL